MSQPNLPGSNNGQPNLQLQGGAAIVAPVSAFPGGVPGNALIVLPLAKASDELNEAMKKGPVALEIDRMWEMLGFNGPAVQVQDADGRPIAIGLEDLLSGLEKHWQEDGEDLNRGRLYAQELMKYSRFEQAEKVLADTNVVTTPEDLRATFQELQKRPKYAAAIAGSAPCTEIKSKGQELGQ
jgi:hypothetical protein